MNSKKTLIFLCISIVQNMQLISCSFQHKNTLDSLLNALRSLNYIEVENILQNIKDIHFDASKIEAFAKNAISIRTGYNREALTKRFCCGHEYANKRDKMFISVEAFIQKYRKKGVL